MVGVGPVGTGDQRSVPDLDRPDDVRRRYGPLRIGSTSIEQVDPAATLLPAGPLQTVHLVDLLRDHLLEMAHEIRVFAKPLRCDLLAAAGLRRQVTSNRLRTEPVLEDEGGLRIDTTSCIPPPRSTWNTKTPDSPLMRRQVNGQPGGTSAPMPEECHAVPVIEPEREAAIAQAATEVDWSAYTMPPSTDDYRPEDVPLAFRQLLSSTTQLQAESAYSAVLESIAHNHSGSLYPAAAPAAGLLTRIAVETTGLSRQTALQLLADLRAFSIFDPANGPSSKNTRPPACETY